jgi:hypothetical protein
VTGLFLATDYTDLHELDGPLMPQTTQKIKIESATSAKSAGKSLLSKAK